MQVADAHQRAGRARASPSTAIGFAAELTRAIEAQPLVRVVREEVTAHPATASTIVATGPLTSPALSAALERDARHRRTSTSTTRSRRS